MKIGILGSGRMGGHLGRMFAGVGHEVVFSYARDAAKLARLAEQAGPGTRAGSPAEAVADADLVLLAVHWLRVDDVLAQAGDLGGKTVISCCVPLDAGDAELVVAHTCSGAEVLARRLPDAHLVAAFQSTPSELLPRAFDARAAAVRPSVVFCGDDAGSKVRVAGLIDQIGFDPVDAGALRVARYIEPFGMLSAVLAYSTDQGPAWAYRFGRIDRLIG